MFREGAGVPNARHERWRRQIDAMEYAFNKLSWEGLPGTDISVVDHAVASGLLMLQLSSFFFELHKMVFGVEEFHIPAKPKALLERSFSPLLGGEDEKLILAYYEASVRRISGAAFHNLEPNWFASWGIECPFPLSLHRDTTLYVPIILDILQDWDRRTYPAKLDSLAIDGLDVQIEAQDKPQKVHLLLRDKERRRKIREELDSRLTGWRRYVRIS